MEVSRLQRSAIEVFKTLKFFKFRLHAHIFQERFTLTRRKNYLVVKRAKTTTFGKKSLMTLGPKISNSLPKDVKET